MIVRATECSYEGGQDLITSGSSWEALVELELSRILSGALSVASSLHLARCAAAVAVRISRLLVLLP